MSKAEEKAIEHCCAKCVHNKFGCGMKLLSHGRDCIKCGNYIKGYHQAEEDLALTIEDIKKIHAFLYAVKNNKQGAFTFTKLSDENYQEVLSRFKTIKKGKRNEKNNYYM